VVEVISPGPGRRPPPCPYFERCGGCQLQHLDDALQSRLKAEATVETLERLGRLRLPGPPEVLTARHWGWRLRTQLHTRRVEVAAGGPAVEVGYFARGSHDLVPVASCPILVPVLEGLLPELPSLLAARTPRRLDLAAGGIATPGGGEPSPTAVTVAPVIEGLPHGEVSLWLPDPSGGDGGFTYAYDARTFFQGHRDLVADLVERAVGPWRGEAAWDLYAGVGLFALPLARRYGRVVAVEGDSVAARYARVNARRNRVPNVEVVPRALESWMPRLPAGAERVIVDPPRGGIGRAVRDLLLDRAPDRLTYVSCHAATLARDLRALTAGYALESLVLLDMFPQSGHMEVVAQLTRRSSSGVVAGSSRRPRMGAGAG
jgi:23S rRNA (uracil1939-C5)-methyltransferase